jgi:hypothetical protein
VCCRQFLPDFGVAGSLRGQFLLDGDGVALGRLRGLVLAEFEPDRADTEEGGGPVPTPLEVVGPGGGKFGVEGQQLPQELPVLVGKLHLPAEQVLEDFVGHRVQGPPRLPPGLLLIVPLRDRLLLGGENPEQPGRGPHHARDQKEHDRPHRHDRPPVPPHELSEPVPRPRRPGQDWLVG